MYVKCFSPKGLFIHLKPLTKPSYCLNLHWLSAVLFFTFIIDTQQHPAVHYCHQVSVLCQCLTCKHKFCKSRCSQASHCHYILPAHQSPYCHHLYIEEEKVWAKSLSCSSVQQQQTGCSAGLLLLGLCAGRSTPALWPPQVGAVAAFPAL